MQQLQLLMQALEYIEQNLTTNMKTEEIAKHCYCSKSSLEKLFRCINNISVHDYIARRRMTYAGRLLLEDKDIGVLQIALELGFGSHEAFTRAFKQVWNCTPSQYRQNKHHIELFPQYAGYTAIGEGEHMKRKNVDISKLYDLFRERRECYFICGDIQGLIGFNDISIKAGDLAIIEALNRMEAAAGEGDVVFRIGADEFVIVTDSTDKAYANRLVEEILSHNGESFAYVDRALPLALYASAVLLEGTKLCYRDLFEKLHHTIMESKFKK